MAKGRKRLTSNNKEKLGLLASRAMDWEGVGHGDSGAALIRVDAKIINCMSKNDALDGIRKIDKNFQILGLRWERPMDGSR